MKNTVSIALNDQSSLADRLAITLDGVLRGEVDLPVVEEQQSPVLPALIMLGFESVHLLDEAGRRTTYTVSDFLNSKPVSFAGALPSLGLITLTRRWSEPLEGYRLDVAFNGAAVKSVDAGMNVKTLREILVQLGFTVGHVNVEQFAQAA